MEHFSKVKNENVKNLQKCEKQTGRKRKCEPKAQEISNASKV